MDVMKNGLIIDAGGNKLYFKDNLLHRENGPAVEYYSGSKEWYVDGKRHREDGPAIEWFDGAKYWYFNGKLHREDGPAIEYADGGKVWYLDDEEIDCKDNEEFLKMMKYKWLL
jgi:hypothetical protein